MTVVVVAVLGVWWFAVYNRLLRLRARVKDAWNALEHEPDDETLRNQYNARVKTYNDALETFPANVVSLISGFKAARRYRADS